VEKLSDHEVWNERYIVVFIDLEGTEALWQGVGFVR